MEATELAPGAVRTGMEPPPVAVRPPRSASSRLKPEVGSGLEPYGPRGVSRPGTTGRQRRAGERESHLGLRREYGRVYNDAVAILSRQDPALAEFRKVSDAEYEVEAQAILPRLRDAASEIDVRRALEEEFSRLFGPAVAKLGERADLADWAVIGAEVWQAVERERGVGSSRA